MPLQDIYSFLVHPAKGIEEPPLISGVLVPKSGKLLEMLDRLYKRAEIECTIDILFSPDATGKQKNPCRDVLLAHLQQPSMAKARAIAERLQGVTTNRSGLGLLFVLRGKEAKTHRLVISRFPADQGIIAQENAQKLDISFLENVFMKNTHAYKSASFRGASLAGDFWTGKVVDKQVDRPSEISRYWIQDFLASELRLSPAAGSKRLANAFKDAIRDAGRLEVRTELVAASLLVPGLNGKSMSPAKLAAVYGLSDESQAALKDALPRHEAFEEKFLMDSAEFRLNVAYRSVELDNGATLTAENDRFDQVFVQETLKVAEGTARRYVTEGSIVDQRLRKIQ